MPPFSNIQACVFDAYGTLFDIHAPAASIAEELGDAARPLSDLWRRKQLEYTWLRSLMGAHADFWQLTGDGLDYALEVHGIGDADIRERLMNLYENLEAYPDAGDTLTRLKEAGYTTAILSNGAPSMLSSAIRHSGLAALIDHPISIEDAGIYKPSPRVYQLAVERTGARPEEICFVSANAWDVAGSASFGFQVAHLNRFGQPPERLPGKPKAVIASLSELPALIG
ncbi:(S)-2-haloacid dehalogenase 4A [bacterium BMS3Bbin10]|nr:(S)-2-haloacid dehalogenase 4A [bacterium BMS3Bbin10]